MKRSAPERGNAFNRADLIQAVKDGARLRLRPKVMTVATTVAGLLPIMWSTSTGSEVMRPLATPVIGGMLSSLVHILIVTPVLFAWLRERELAQPGIPSTRTAPALVQPNEFGAAQVGQLAPVEPGVAKFSGASGLAEIQGSTRF